MRCWRYKRPESLVTPDRQEQRDVQYTLQALLSLNLAANLMTYELLREMKDQGTNDHEDFLGVNWSWQSHKTLSVLMSQCALREWAAKEKQMSD